MGERARKNARSLFCLFRRSALLLLVARGRGSLGAVKTPGAARSIAAAPALSSFWSPPSFFTAAALSASTSLASTAAAPRATCPHDAPCPPGSLAATVCEAAEAGQPLEESALRDASPGELVAAAVALNACSKPPPKATYAAVGSALAAVAHHLTPRQLATAAASFADAGAMCPALKDAVAEQVMSRMGAFDPHTLARTVRAYGALALHDEGMMDAVADRLACDWQAFSPEDLAKIGDAAARVGYRSEALMHAFSEACAALAAGGDAAALASMADALRRVGAMDPALADRAAALFASDPSCFDAASLPTLLYALTAAGHGDEGLLRAAAPVAAACLGEMKSKDLVRLARAYGWAGVLEAELFAALEDEVAKRVQRRGFAMGGLVDILDSFNRVSFTTPALAKLAPMPAGLRPA